MPRRSAADLSVIPVQFSPRRLQPPSDLSANERRIFNEVVNSMPPDYFIKSDALMLCAFVQAAWLSRSLGKRVLREQHLASAWERATRTMALLATRLRLTPRSRTDLKMVSRKIRNHQPGIDDAIAASGVDLDD